MHDPKQLFVVSAITRESIAEDLNVILEVSDVDDRLLPDDDRLTDEVCREYAKELGEIDLDLPQFAQDEEEVLLCERVIKSIGIDID